MPTETMDKDLMVKCISLPNGQAVFLIGARAGFIADMMGELISQGVTGMDNFPLFGKFLNAVTDAANS